MGAVAKRVSVKIMIMSGGELIESDKGRGTKS